MAGISISYTTPNINPTPNFLPINNGTLNFGDSCIYYGSGRLQTKIGGVNKGMSLDFGANIYSIGDTQTLSVGTGLGGYAFVASGTNLTETFAGGSSGKHLIIQINGTIYKIQLLNNTP